MARMNFNKTWNGKPGYWTQTRVSFLVGCVYTQQPFTSLEKDEEHLVLSCEAQKRSLPKRRRMSESPRKIAHMYTIVVDEAGDALCVTGENTGEQAWRGIRLQINELIKSGVLDSM